MKIVEIKELKNGSHCNQTINGTIAVPDGWAKIPENMELENFPFGKVITKEVNGIMTVTKWVPGIKPEPIPDLEPEDEGNEVGAIEQLRADVDYIAIMTGVEL